MSDSVLWTGWWKRPGNTEEEAAKVAAVGIVMEVSSESGAGLTLKGSWGDLQVKGTCVEERIHAPALRREPEAAGGLP